MSAGRQHLIIYPSPSVIQFMAIHWQRMELVPKCGGKIPPTHPSTPFNEHSTIVMLAKKNKPKSAKIAPANHLHEYVLIFWKASANHRNWNFYDKIAFLDLRGTTQPPSCCFLFFSNGFLSRHVKSSRLLQVIQFQECLASQVVAEQSYNVQRSHFTAPVFVGGGENSLIPAHCCCVFCKENHQGMETSSRSHPKHPWNWGSVPFWTRPKKKLHSF